MQQLKGKVAVITGAASGIGLAVARKCSAEAMKIVLVDIEAPALDTVAAQFRADGHDVLPVVCDVSKFEQVEALAEAAYTHFGAVHFLFNNAGVAGGSTIWGSPLSEWEWVLGVNLWGIIHGVKAFVPRMIAAGESGHVVNTSSIAGLITGASMGIYRVSKHAAVALSETLACELAQAEHPIGVSVLCPSWVRTRIFDSKRNRPSETEDIPLDKLDAVNPQIAQQLRAAGEAVENADSAEMIADAVIDAILEERFYILPHPRLNKAIEIRMQDILQDRQPTNLAANKM